MIVVIADDLSGAAELAGIAARYGCRAEVHTVYDPNSNADVIAVDTDTRWRTQDQAARIVSDVTRTILAVKPALIFKKTDSVLRGHVRAEIEAILDVTGQSKSLLIPANPSKGRIIRSGVYYIGSVQLDLTAFRHDPEHPRWTSLVADLLKSSNASNRLLVPDATCIDDLAARAVKVDNFTLPAGGADFFEAILNTQGRSKIDAPFTLQGVALFVCGSSAAWDHGRGEQCAAHHVPVCPMPEALFNGNSDRATMDKWCSETSDALAQHRRAMLAIGRPSRPSSNRSAADPRQLLEFITQAAARVVATQPVNCLALEGGSTAAAVLKHFGWNTTQALATELTGIAVLLPEAGPTLLIKPGSYPWTGVLA